MTFSTTRVRRLLLTVSLIAVPTLAQISGGAFRGEIRDASNAVVPQAKIAIRSNDNGMDVSPSRMATDCTSLPT